MHANAEALAKAPILSPLQAKQKRFGTVTTPQRWRTGTRSFCFMFFHPSLINPLRIGIKTTPPPHLQLERARLQIGQEILGDDLGDLEGRAEIW